MAPIAMDEGYLVEVDDSDGGRALEQVSRTRRNFRTPNPSPIPNPTALPLTRTAGPTRATPAAYGRLTASKSLLCSTASSSQTQGSAKRNRAALSGPPTTWQEEGLSKSQEDLPVSLNLRCAVMPSVPER